MILDELVDHRGEFRRAGAQRRQEFAVLTCVMSVNRRAKAKAMAEQVGSLVVGEATVGGRVAQRRESLSQGLVDLDQLFAQRRDAVRLTD